MTKLEQVQKISCLLLDEFIRICREHNLQWYIDAGSLLGVIRHGGFIPWDSDIDIVLPRADYNLLYAEGDSWFQPPFYLYTSKNCSGDILTIKLNYSNSTFLLANKLTYYRNAENTFVLNGGIGLDIVPLDYIPEEQEKKALLLDMIDFLYDGIEPANPECKNDHQRLLVRAKCQHGAELYNKLMTSISNSPTSKVACTSWWRFDNSRGYTVPADCYSTFIEKSFSGCKEPVRVPIGYDTILKAYYGDYMVEQPDKLQDRRLSKFLIDSGHSYKDYERFSNEELREMIKNNQTL